MLFHSLQFAVFLPVVFALHWALPHKFRWALLLIASYWFYMSWSPKCAVLILFATSISYLAGIFLEKESEKQKRRILFVAVSLACFGMLFFFKYFNFISESTAGMIALFNINVNPVTLNLILPVGISFYTFQTLSYVIDVYKGGGSRTSLGKICDICFLFSSTGSRPYRKDGQSSASD